MYIKQYDNFKTNNNTDILLEKWDNNEINDQQLCEYINKLIDESFTEEINENLVDKIVKTFNSFKNKSVDKLKKFIHDIIKWAIKNIKKSKKLFYLIIKSLPLKKAVIMFAFMAIIISKVAASGGIPTEYNSDQNIINQIGIENVMSEYGGDSDDDDDDDNNYSNFNDGLIKLSKDVLKSLSDEKDFYTFILENPDENDLNNFEKKVAKVHNDYLIENIGLITALIEILEDGVDDTKQLKFIVDKLQEVFIKAQNNKVEGAENSMNILKKLHDDFKGTSEQETGEETERFSHSDNYQDDIQKFIDRAEKFKNVEVDKNGNITIKVSDESDGQSKVKLRSKTSALLNRFLDFGKYKYKVPNAESNYTYNEDNGKTIVTLTTTYSVNDINSIYSTGTQNR